MTPLRDLKVDSPTVVLTAATSLRIIAAAVVFACVYYASSVLITLICALLIAFVLDPGVVLMERLRIPRWLGALIMVLLGLAAVYLVVYLVYDRAVAFVEELPQLTVPIQRIVSRLEDWGRHVWQSTMGGVPQAPAELSVPTVRVQPESQQWVQYLAHGFGSVYAFAVTVMFIPFLVFFMLTSKHRLWASTLNLFHVERRQQVEDVIAGIGHMARQYVLGNALVALISAALLTPAFFAIGLPYALVVAVIAAVLTLIPYLGVALSLGPPLLIGLVQFDRPGPLIAILVAVVVVHVVAINVLTPKLVGGSVKLNALAVTIAMMFWGWLWGAIGLVLAVPITAGFKAVCDKVPSLRAYGRWLGDD
ncbi:MAG TPA: AI-2E family transporter [Terriglobia bacterium]|nr:AI-2E family transporter [Terriglobia bacterium]